MTRKEYWAKYYAENRERLLQKNKDFMSANKGYRAEWKLKSEAYKVWYEKTKDERNEKAREWGKNNTELTRQMDVQKASS